MVLCENREKDSEGERPKKKNNKVKKKIGEEQKIQVEGMMIR